MRYGLPYKGSKNGIAEWLVDELPKADIFVDLFCGGGAITHRAMLSGKYKRFIMNDIDGRLPILFKDCANGKYTVENHPEWVTREEFNAKKDIDAYIALVWSFGNNGKDYLYGADIENMKHAYHKAVYEGDIDALKPYGYNLSPSDAKTVYGRYLDYQRQVKRQTPQIQLEVVTRQTEIERLQSLQSLQSLDRDYADVDIPDGALIYCDIPYKGSNCGKYQGFDHDRFYAWALEQDNIYISEYDMPDGFIPFAHREKTVLSAADGNGYKADEIIFTNERTYHKLTMSKREYIKLNFAEQLSLFDIGFNPYQE